MAGCGGSANPPSPALTQPGPAHAWSDTSPVASPLQSPGTSFGSSPGAALGSRELGFGAVLSIFTCIHPAS